MALSIVCFPVKRHDLWTHREETPQRLEWITPNEAVTKHMARAIFFKKYEGSCKNNTRPNTTSAFDFGYETFSSSSSLS
jgi:hypothetical protein